MNASRFPLLRLPVACSQLVLRILIPIQLIAISVLSKKCKELVQSIGIKIRPIMCRIGCSIRIGVVFKGEDRLFVEFNITDVENGKYVLKKPSKTVPVRFHRNNFGWRQLTLSENRLKVREWLEHLQFLFGCSNVCVVFSEQSFGFDIDSLRENFQDICQLMVYHTGCYRFNQLVLQKFLPVKTLSLSPSCFRNSRIPHDLLIQNFRTIRIIQRHGLTHLNLNDLLMMNSKSIEIPNIQKSLKEFNKFLKLWMKGANPNLELISLRHSNWNVEDVETVMKGIKYQLIPRALARVHQTVRARFIVHGGRDIHRYDGVKATVLVIKTLDRQTTVTMFVWHDHCFVP